jgi:hypothetical protein
MPKAFKDSDGVKQRNAIESWVRLSPRPEIILFGNDAGVAEIASELGLRHIKDVKCNKFGTPLVNDLFEQAQAAATNNLLCYINSDIILFDDFMPAVSECAGEFNEFLMVGQRWDTIITSPIDYKNPNWQDDLKRFAIQTGYIHSVAGIDYFVFTRGLWPAIPDFGIGRTAWDNWLVGNPIENGKAVVDATDAVFIVHQDHGYVPFKGREDQEAVNRELAGKTMPGFTSRANWQLTPYGLKLRNVVEFLQDNYPDIPLIIKCIDCACNQAPDVAKKQYEHMVSFLPPQLLADMAVNARLLLDKGIAAGAARLILETPLKWQQEVIARLIKTGLDHWKNNKFAESAGYLHEASIRNNKVPELNYMLAFALAKTGRLSDASKACIAELRIQPNHNGSNELLRILQKNTAGVLS